MNNRRSYYFSYYHFDLSCWEREGAALLHLWCFLWATLLGYETCLLSARACLLSSAWLLLVSKVVVLSPRRSQFSILRSSHLLWAYLWPLPSFSSSFWPDFSPRSKLWFLFFACLLLLRRLVPLSSGHTPTRPHASPFVEAVGWLCLDLFPGLWL